MEIVIGILILIVAYVGNEYYKLSRRDILRSRIEYMLTSVDDAWISSVMRDAQVDFCFTSEHWKLLMEICKELKQDMSRRFVLEKISVNKRFLKLKDHEFSLACLFDRLTLISENHEYNGRNLKDFSSPRTPYGMRLTKDGILIFEIYYVIALCCEYHLHTSDLSKSIKRIIDANCNI